jgi:hypothetical protein
VEDSVSVSWLTRSQSLSSGRVLVLGKYRDSKPTYKFIGMRLEVEKLSWCIVRLEVLWKVANDANVLSTLACVIAQQMGSFDVL